LLTPDRYTAAILLSFFSRTISNIPSLTLFLDRYIVSVFVLLLDAGGKEEGDQEEELLEYSGATPHYIYTF
jgi:hypothetical protein